jgi:hypothetical protein
VDRDYKLPNFSSLRTKVEVPPEFQGLESIRYSVGQPMGALSS